MDFNIWEIRFAQFAINYECLRYDVMTNLILDIGNTRTKAAVMADGEVKELVVVDDIRQLDIGRLHRTHHIDKAIASVVGPQPDFRALLPAPLYERFHQLGYRSKMPIKIDYETPQTLGMDRVAAVVGARELCGGGPLIVVDAGSCITIDILDGGDCYKGGAILPGMQMRLRAMNDYTAALPLVTLTAGEREGEEEIPITGRSTRASMVSGVCNAVLFEIQGFAEKYRALFPNVKLFLTGGDAVFFAKRLFFPNFANPNLMYIGLDKILNMNIVS